MAALPGLFRFSPNQPILPCNLAAVTATTFLRPVWNLRLACPKTFWKSTWCSTSPLPLMKSFAFPGMAANRPYSALITFVWCRPSAAPLPAGRAIANGIQTNGTLLTKSGGAFWQQKDSAVGLSLDGPRAMHDRHRVAGTAALVSTETMRGYEVLRRFGVPTDILCVVSSHNARHPGRVYRFFKEIVPRHVSFLPRSKGSRRRRTT